ncbi:hypothetical protein [Streptomyces showdoensis]|uniref:hypothetical protein n=1 Tax=Streptomyces showdoensis TaxID=68268 RepID=UPI0031E80AC5
MVDDPADGRPAVGGVLGVDGELPGVGADQVVEAVAPEAGGAVGAQVLQEAHLGEVVEQPVALVGADGAGSGGDRAVEDGDRRQAEAAVAAGEFGGELVVRGVQREPYGVLAAEAERVEPGRAGSAERARHGGEGLLGPGGQPGRGDGDRERQAGAEGGDLLGRLGLPPDPLGADPPGEQLDGVGRGQHAELLEGGAVDAEGRQPPAARDDDEAARGAGQQRADLGGAEGVVEHDGEPEPRGVGAPERRGLGGLDGDVLDTERPEEPPEDLAGGGGAGVGQVAAQVRVELPVREAVGEAVEPAGDERRLADPGGSADDGEERAAAELREECVQGVEGVGAPGEVLGRGEELPRGRPYVGGGRGARCGRYVDVDVAPDLAGLHDGAVDGGRTGEGVGGGGVIVGGGGGGDLGRPVPQDAPEPWVRGRRAGEPPRQFRAGGGVGGRPAA